MANFGGGHPAGGRGVGAGGGDGGRVSEVPGSVVGADGYSDAGGGGGQGSAGQGGAVLVHGQDAYGISGVQLEESNDDRMSRVAGLVQQEEEQLLQLASEADTELALADLWSQTYSFMEKN